MSCLWCAHFSNPIDFSSDYDPKKDPLTNKGFCTFNPEWLEVMADHYCGRFVWKSYYDTSTQAAQMARSLDHLRADLKKAKDEVKRLKESNRKLRTKQSSK